MKKIWKMGIGLLAAGTMLFGTAAGAYAGEVTVDEGDKPYIAFGADLSGDQKATVLGLFGISDADLGKYTVVTITNEQEHQYLDEYIPAEKIGTHALSSVVVMEGKPGSGIQVTTKNINYCTSGMYQNALATAGVEDAEVIVAGPMPISGTAALIGAIEAYSVMSGDEVEENVIDGAVEEIVITGQIEEETGSTDEIEGMIAYLKEQLANGDLSDDEIKDAVDQAQVQFNVQLTQDQVDQIVELLKKLQGLDLDWDNLAEQAQGVYDRLKDMGIDFDSEEFVQEAEGFFAKIGEFFEDILAFFQNLFHF